jgi:4-hydroxy-tetrahydrodipicolinate synthase
MQTPFTESDKIDYPVLAKQVDFLDRCRVHGMVWPQLASEYFTLSVDERMRGMEIVMKAGASARPAIVLGVQADDARQASAYARKATELGADAIIAIPPREQTKKEVIFDYYRKIGESSPLPFFVQAIGDMSFDFVVSMAKEIPTLRYIKDEAGPVVARVSEFRAKAPELNPFTGSHGKNLFDEMVRGVAGNMPAAAWADLYAGAWDAFEGGKKKKAAELCAQSIFLVAEAEAYGLEAVKYILELRGVFPNSKVRKGGGKGGPLDDNAKRSIREMVDQVKGNFRT